MQIHHYDNTTGEHIGTGQADPDQKIKDSFLIPAYATPKQPPELMEQTVAVYLNTAGTAPRKHSDGEWSLIADYRGYIGYDEDGLEQKITEIGIEPDETWTLTLPTKVWFDEATNTKKSAIESARDTALKLPDAIVHASGANWQVDPTAMSELNDILTLSTALGAVPDGIEWRDADNVNHPATLELLLSIAAARAIQKDAIWKKSWQLKGQVDALVSETATQADFDAILVDFS